MLSDLAKERSLKTGGETQVDRLGSTGVQVTFVSEHLDGEGWLMLDAVLLRCVAEQASEMQVGRGWLPPEQWREANLSSEVAELSR